METIIDKATSIKANELRIGNWFTYGNQLVNDKVFKIDFDRNEGHLINGAIPEDHLQPVPLTPELLEKAGFRHDVEDDTSYYKKNGLWFCHAGDDWFLSTHTEFKPFHYLHQLQNLLYALTGEELTIDLN